MIKRFSPQRDVLGNILAACEIHATEGAGENKIAVERLQIHLDQPAGVSLELGGVNALGTVRRRRPFQLLPLRPPDVINRSGELENLRKIVSSLSVADLNGPDGAGKSALAASLAHDLDLSQFPDGAVYVTGPILPQDLLQALFESFYESSTPVKITPQRAHAYLYNLRALVILDDVGLGPKQIDPILDALGNSAVLIAGPERAALGRGHSVVLQGLSRQDAVALFESGQQELSPEEHPVIEQICALLNNMPLPILCVAGYAAQSRVSLTKLLTDLRERRPWSGPGGDVSIGPSLEQIVLAMDGTDRQLLTLAAAFAGSSVSWEALQTLADLSEGEFRKRVEGLQQLGMLDVLSPRSRRRSQPRLALAPAYRHAVQTWLVDDATRLEVVNYYTARLNRGDWLSGEELPGLLGAIESCASNGWLTSLKPLVAAADRALVGLGWWAQGQHVLDLTRRAAQAGGDRALEAWAMHQLGSLLGALGDFERALHLLRTALHVRQALGDEESAALSAQNLRLLEQLAPVAEPVPEQATPRPTRQATGPLAEQAPVAAQEEEDEPEPPRGAGCARRLRRIGLTALALLVVLALGALAVRLALQSGEEETVEEPAGLSVTWEFVDAWNALDNQTWTQEISISATGGDGQYSYFVNGQQVTEVFAVVLPICDGAWGTIEVQSGDGLTGQVEYEFDSPFCR